MSASKPHSEQDIDVNSYVQARSALAAMRQRLVQLDGWTWEANYEMVDRELRSLVEQLNAITELVATDERSKVVLKEQIRVVLGV